MVLGGWTLTSSILGLTPSFQVSPSISTLCLPALPILSSALLLAVQFFIRPSGVLDRQRITAL